MIFRAKASFLISTLDLMSHLQIYIRKNSSQRKSFLYKCSRYLRRLFSKLRFLKGIRCRLSKDLNNDEIVNVLFPSEPEIEKIDWLAILKEGEPEPQPLGSESELSDWSDLSTNEASAADRLKEVDEDKEDAANYSVLGSKISSSAIGKCKLVVFSWLYSARVLTIILKMIKLNDIFA